MLTPAVLKGLLAGEANYGNAVMGNAGASKKNQHWSSVSDIESDRFLSGTELT